MVQLLPPDNLNFAGTTLVWGTQTLQPFYRSLTAPFRLNFSVEGGMFFSKDHNETSFIDEVSVLAVS